MTLHPPSSSEPAWAASDLAENPHLAADKADRVQRMFGAIAKRYDLNNRIHSFGRDQAWRRTVVRLAEVKPTDHVLDVACGTGDLTQAFADTPGGVASVTGLDFTAAMLDLAREKAHRCAAANRSGLQPTYIQGDAMALPFKDGSFDVVSIAFGIRNVAQPARALAEFRRVLRPGGRVVILEFSTPPNPVIRWFNRLYCERLMPITATLIARDRSGAYRYLPRSVSTFMNQTEMEQALRAARFDRLRMKPMTFGVCTAYLGFTSA